MKKAISDQQSATRDVDVHPSSRRGITKWLRLVASMLGTFLALLATAVIALWLIGRIFTDRFVWSQWLFWIPTPALLPVIVLGLVASFRPARRVGRRRNRLLFWSATGVLLLAYFGFVEHRFLRSGPTSGGGGGGGLKIMHWNAEPAVYADFAPSVDAVIEVDADLTILTDPSAIPQETELHEWMGVQVQLLYPWPFAVLTRLPVIELRPLIAVDRIYVTILKLDATEKLGREIVLYLVDLPSNPRLPRMEIARRVRTMLDELDAPAPDLVLGDLNIARGSASLKKMFPNLKNAFDESGTGYGATFHRGWPLPLYHIDHTLLNDDLRALQYDLIDTGVSRHRAQVAWIGNAARK